MSNKEWLEKLLEKNSVSDLYKEEYKDYYNELRKIYDDFPQTRKKLQSIKSKYTRRVNATQIENNFFVRGRVKSKEHLIIKILRDYKENKEKGKIITLQNYVDSFKDLIGIRVVCMNQNDKILFLQKLINNKNKIEINNIRFYCTNEAKEQEYKKIQSTFPSIHSEIRVRDEEKPYDCIHAYGCDENEEKIVFEIQIRTFFEEAWGEVDHTLKYPYNMEDDFLKEQMSILFSVSEVADKIITSVFKHKNKKNVT